MDITRHLRQCLALFQRQAPRRAHPRKLPRQHDGHHAQITDQCQQQASHAFRVAPAAMATMQLPDPTGGTLTLQQHAQAFRKVDARSLERLVDVDDHIQQGGHHYIGIGIERGQDRQRVGQHLGWVAQLRACIDRIAPGCNQPIRQRAIRQPRHGSLISSGTGVYGRRRRSGGGHRTTVTKAS